uniref:MBG domain-containing protein n=1 Tax=uncultured Tenacibaculum sp. TaxID=174713 RepID=UPI002613A15B
YQITTGSLAGSDAFTGSLTRVSGETVGTYAINQGSLALNSNYTLTYVSNNLTIVKRVIEVTADAKTKLYRDTDPALTYQITTGSLVGSDAFTGSLTRVSGETVGTYAINQGSLALSNNYTLTYVSNNLTIGKRTIEVTADAKTKLYGDTDPALTYQITSGSLVGGDTFTGNLTRATGETVGAYAINQGSLALNNNYTLTYVSSNLTIGKRAVEVTADAKAKFYGDTDPALTYQITTGSLAGSDVFTGSLTRVSGETVGAYAINQGSLALNSNYTLTYVSNNLTIGKRVIEVTADAKTKLYGDTDPALTYQITSGSLVGGDTFTGNLTRVSGETVGTYAINQGSLALNNNYTLTYVSSNLTIGKRAVEVTADAKAKFYGDTDPALTYQITTGSLAGSDAFTGSLTRVSGETVGAYAINQGSLALNSNYTLTYVSNNLTIGKRVIEVTADAKTKLYGDTDPALTYQITSGSLVEGDTFTGSLTRVSGETVGTYAINQGSLALTNNYTLTYVSNNLTIGSRAITITADAKTKVYGEIDPALTYQITSGSLVGSDAFTGDLTRAGGEAQGNYGITQGTLALNNNYDITFVGANFYIDFRFIRIVPTTAIQKTYGDADPAKLNFPFVITQGSLAFDDAIEVYGRFRDGGENVGNYQIRSLTSLVTSTNGGQSSYSITYTNAGSARLLINPREIEVTADGKSKEYGDLDPTLTYQITKGALQFTDAFTGSLERVVGEALGSYAINKGTLTPGSNYTVTFVGNNLTIGKRLIEITADAKSKSYGDIDPSLTYQITSGSLVGSDTFTGSLTRVSGETLGTYTINQGSLTLNNNYTLTYISNNLTIGKRMVEVTADAKTKLYGDTDPTLTYQITSGSLVGGDAFTGSLTRVSGELVGTYAINQGTLALNNNYTLNFISSNLNITPASNQVIWSGKINKEWTQGTNWSGNTAPTNTQNALIPNVANTPEVGTTAQVNDLTIESLSSFDITENGGVLVDGNLVNDGTFMMTSTASNSASLIVKGTSNGQVTYERGGLISNQWSIVTAPVAGQSIKDFVENPANNIRVNTTLTPNRYAVGYYDDTRPTGDKWVYYTVDNLASNSITFEKGQSYAISRATNGSVTFTGTIETADVNKSVVVSEWNAVGNPYTAFLPINENSGTNFINDNLASFDPAYVGVYVWDNTQSKYIAKTLVSGESSLAPGQGFFVKTTGSANNMAFKQAQRMLQPATGGTFSKGSNIPTIELSIASKGVQVNTSISYRNNATSGLDAGYDVGNFDGAELDIYTRLLDGSSEKNFTYQSLPSNSKENSIIPVGIKVKAGTFVTISGKGLSLPVGVEMYLEDRELGKFINLNEEDYALTIGKAINGVGRFYLHTKTQVEIPEITLADIKLYNTNNTLFVEGVQGEQFEITMYNTAGMLVYQDRFEGTSKNSIALPLVEVGVYIVRVATNVGTKSKKIILKKSK